MTRTLSCLLALLLALACSNGGLVQTDAADDLAVDTAADAAVDAPGDDAAPDAISDVVADLGPDATPDLPADVPDASDADASDAPDLTGVPILDRSPRVTTTCSVVHDAVALADTFDYWSGADIAGVGADVLLVRGQNAGNDTVVASSTVALDGTLGAPHTLASMTTWSWVRPRAAGGPDGVGVVYVEGDQPSYLAFVRTDATGAVLDGPVTLAGTSGLGNAAIVRTADGYAVLGAATQGPALRLVRLDRHGAVLGSASNLPTQGNYVNWPPPSLVAVEGGFVAGWTETGTNEPVAAIARLDAQGQVQGSVLRLNFPGYGTKDPTVVAIEGGYLLAWTESWMAEGWNGPGWDIVMVQHLSGDLAPEGKAATLQAPHDNITCHSPTWVDLGSDTPGLAYTCGVLYTICAGCVPTETVGFVALHVDDLVPASQRVLVKSPVGGGLLNPRFVRQGSDFYVYADLTFHALNQPSLSALRCL